MKVVMKGVAVQS